jgi:hypothetical protein
MMPGHVSGEELLTLMRARIDNLLQMPRFSERIEPPSYALMNIEDRMDKLKTFLIDGSWDPASLELDNMLYNIAHIARWIKQRDSA